jgi:carbamoyl-phosphate synthase large subunit
MTDTDFADRTYIEPITPEMVAKIIERERPDALLPTIGGQTGLNIAVSLHEMGILQKYGVELIGANFDAILKAEDRDRFRKAMEKLGLVVPRSGYIRSLDTRKSTKTRFAGPWMRPPNGPSSSSSRSSGGRSSSSR